jgi:beta-galactosidase
MRILHADLPLRSAPGSPFRLPQDAVATRWVEGFAVEDAEVLAEYEHPHFGRWPSYTSGAGNLLLCGPRWT